MTRLPALMVAPNGARHGKADHPALPITLDEILKTATACHAEGADGLHLHLRDAAGAHLLDAGRYREAVAALADAVPDLVVQITTEAVGRYDAAHQREVALTAGAALVSLSIRELMAGTAPAAAQDFVARCEDEGIALQFILYDMDDLDLLQAILPPDLFGARTLQVLFVLGRYTRDRNSRPGDLDPFLQRMAARDWHPDWAVCAFGPGETACLAAAHAHGGKLRVGFENSFHAADGGIARDNAQRVREIRRMLRQGATAAPLSDTPRSP